MSTTATPSQRANAWHEHINNWQASGLTQKAYCEQANVSYVQFGYWRQRLKERDHAQSVDSPLGGFVPVAHSHAQTSATFIIRLPNGISVENIALEHLTTTCERLYALS
jgi:hypothetical protein